MKTYTDFIRASLNYLARPTEDGLAIHYDITFGCWVYFDAESTGVATGIIGKWNETGVPGERSYVIYKSASNVITLSVSSNGGSVVSVTDLGANYVTDQWFYVVGRFTPSTELALFVNGMWYRNTTGIPVTLFNSSEDFEIGRYNESNYLDGRISQAFVSAYSIPDRFICAMYSHAKGLYMHKHLYPGFCSSSSSSSSSTSISSSSTSTTSSSSSSSTSTTSSSSSSVIP